MPTGETLLFVWGLLGFALHVVVAYVLFTGVRRVARLHELALPDSAEFAWPRISIVIAARNEQRHIREALRSVLQLDYPDFEVIAVNDRSTDATGAILDEFAAAEPRLQVVHLHELPTGWLGKNHALERGAERATGKYLLFTDADIVMEPAALRRAVAHVERNSLDHLAMTPRVVMPGLLLQSFAVTFTIFFTAYFQPWKAKDPRSPAYVGIGAFNLVRTAVYRAIDGHQPIAMRPDDDMMLGRVIKRRGYRQEVVDGTHGIWVPWYGSLGEVIRGLEKNAFSGVDYSIATTVISSLLAFVFNVAPFVLVLVATGPARLLFAGSVALLLFLSLGTARALQTHLASGLLFPVTVLFFIYIQWRTMLLTLWNNGIRWRDTYYPLAELKANRVP